MWKRIILAQWGEVPTLFVLFSCSNITWGDWKIKNVLIVIIENITLNQYEGEERSMLVTNHIFHIGCATMIITNDLSRRSLAKMEFTHSLRTHHDADDSAYHVVFHEEDVKGVAGISLPKVLYESSV